MQSGTARSRLKSIFIMTKFNLNSSLSGSTQLFSCNFFKPCNQSNHWLQKLTKAVCESSKYYHEFGIEEPFRNFGLDGWNVPLSAESYLIRMGINGYIKYWVVVSKLHCRMQGHGLAKSFGTRSKVSLVSRSFVSQLFQNSGEADTLF